MKLIEFQRKKRIKYLKRIIQIAKKNRVRKLSKILHECFRSTNRKYYAFYIKFGNYLDFTMIHEFHGFINLENYEINSLFPSKLLFEEFEYDMSNKDFVICINITFEK